MQKRSADRRLFPGCWDLVGGHVEEGETVPAALMREIREETGWAMGRIGPELSPKIWTADGCKYLERQFIVTVEGDLISPQLEVAKVTEYRWIDERNLAILKSSGLYGESMIYQAVQEGLQLTRPSVPNR